MKKSINYRSLLSTKDIPVGGGFSKIFECFFVERNWSSTLEVEDFPTHFDQHILGGGFKYFLFSPLFGEGSHFD